MNAARRSTLITMAEAADLLTGPGALYEMDNRLVGGRPMRVYRHAQPNLRAVFDASRRHGAREFLVYEDERITFEQHWRAVGALGRAFLARGVGKGDRVAIAMRNYPQWSIAFWAAVAIGAVATPLNAWGAGEDLLHSLTDSGARLAVMDVERLDRLEPHLASLPGLALLVVRGEHPGAAPLEDLIGPPAGYGGLPDTPLPDPRLVPEDPATIFYTSGTTGRPKGAVGSHRNITTNLHSIGFRTARAAVRRGGAVPRPGDAPTAQRTTLMAVPLFHVTGCHSTLVPCLAGGTRLVLMRKWDAAAALDLIEAEQVNAFGGVPAMALQLCEAAAGRSGDFASLDTLSSGGAPAPPDLGEIVHAAFPSAMTGQGYGATETSSLVASIYGEDQAEHPGTVGPPVPVCDIRLVDDDGGDASRGELWVRGPNVVAGYWNDPEATEAAFADGWYRTGDVADADADGALRILDRRKDMIIRGGENIYCIEVENALATHPAVAEAAVVGLPHRVLGEEVGAVVRLAGPCDAETLRTYLRGRLAAFKIPVAFRFRAEPFPRNAAGKVLKSVLRQELLKAGETP